MPANINPIFTLTPNSIPTFSAAANTGSDGSGALITLVTAGANGTRVDQVTFRNAQLTPAASSTMLCKVFLTDASGLNPQIVGEVALPAATRSATIIGATGVVTFSPALVMKSGQILKICQSVFAGVQDRISVVANAGDF
jgi:hypothetical protein